MPYLFVWISKNSTLLLAYTPKSKAPTLKKSSSMAETEEEKNEKITSFTICWVVIVSSHKYSTIGICYQHISGTHYSPKPFDAQELSIALFFVPPSHLIYNPQKYAYFNGSILERLHLHVTFPLDRTRFPRGTFPPSCHVLSAQPPQQAPPHHPPPRPL